MTQRYRAASGVLSREVGGELLLLNSDSELYFALNASGAAMFRQLIEQEELDSIADSIAVEFEAPIDTVREDLSCLVERLLEKGLIQPDV